MDGGSDPIRHGDPLLFEWAGDVSVDDLVGQRVLVEQREAGLKRSSLKRLGGTGAGYTLLCDNPMQPAVAADQSMRVTARLLRPLHQPEFNPLARYVGHRMKRRAAGALYGMADDPGFQRSGYAINGTDAVLLVTLSKDKMMSGQHYIDEFRDHSFFTWSSQSATAPDSKRGREVLEALRTGIRLHLWVRPEKSVMEFEYCGLVAPVSHEGSKPIQVTFRLLTPLNDDAWRRLGTDRSR